MSVEPIGELTTFRTTVANEGLSDIFSFIHLVWAKSSGFRSLFGRVGRGFGRFLLGFGENSFFAHEEEPLHAFFNVVDVYAVMIVFGQNGAEITAKLCAGRVRRRRRRLFELIEHFLKNIRQRHRSFLGFGVNGDGRQRSDLALARCDESRAAFVFVFDQKTVAAGCYQFVYARDAGDNEVFF